ncbi:MAG: tRNA (adenosine(37)-N6)-threonylcarbamoyltransferase complex ATPase subunit type 1 TsaE [Planctomycetota bacterium]|nr:tRNA (adenosine(37)-N6)-threonylcarbamoyltransferase complex ATPase subunit type 1 TsaE [Planctomycetota bacterium]
MNPDSTTTIQIQSNDERQTMSIAASIARHLRPGDFLALEGPLGSGKTCFVRGLAQGLGLDPDQVSSPTFVLRHEYEKDGDPASPVLTHIDAYRLSSHEDLESIGWEELVKGDRSIVAIEWASRIAQAIPSNRIDVAFAHLDIDQRDLAISAPKDMMDRIEHLADTALARCTQCGQEVASNADTFPFCSKKCRLLDLGKWFRGDYRVSRLIEEDDIMFEE